MNKIERLKKITENVNRKFNEGLNELSYFNSTNFLKNATTFKRQLAYGERISVNGQLAMYSSKLNALIIDEVNLDTNISDEQLELLILHEYIHMASTDLEKQTIGFESESMPITYNEALTQWLTLRMYYGKDNLKQAIEKNILYPESVKRIDALIEKVGEENIFNGFFEADIQKNTREMPKEYKSEWLDEVLYFFNSNEEKVSKMNMEKMQANISAILGEKKSWELDPDEKQEVLDRTAEIVKKSAEEQSQKDSTQPREEDIEEEIK